MSAAVAAAEAISFPARTALYPEEGVPSAVLNPAKALRWLPARRELVKPSYGPAGAFSSVVFEMAAESPLPTSVSFESRPMSFAAALQRAAEPSSRFE